MREIGAKSIKAFATHALIDQFPPGTSLRQAGITELITTDTIVHPYLKPGGVPCTELPVGELFARRCRFNGGGGWRHSRM